jgi:hypothetical protein
LELQVQQAMLELLALKVQVARLEQQELKV